MRVTIAGCGALGSIFASSLVEQGYEVQVYQREGATLEALRAQDGVKVRGLEEGTEKLYPLKTVSSDPAELSASELILVFVKSYHTSALSPLSKLISEGGVVLTLQNGLGNAETLAGFVGEERVAAGVATYGAYTIAPGLVQAAGLGLVSFGPLKPEEDFSWAAEILKSAGFNTEYVEDPKPYIWRKLAVNAMVNTVAALTRLKNGTLKESTYTLELMRRLGLEAVEAARRDGVEINFENLWDFFIDNLTKTASNKPSMLQDVEAGRETEIESISGGVLGYAEYDNEFPYTRSVYELIKGIDDRPQDLNRKI